PAGGVYAYAQQHQTIHNNNNNSNNNVNNSQSQNLQHHQRRHWMRGYEFWHSLGEYLRLRDDPEVSFARERDRCLTRMRDLLDGRENRDVLYSICVAREFTPRIDHGGGGSGFEKSLPQHLDEQDPRNRLAVAKRFIQEESRTTGGTTNVVRR